MRINPLSSIGPPGFWPNETTGRLKPAILAYLNDRTMTPEQIDAMRAYLRQWINAPGFFGTDVDALRATVDSLTTRTAIAAWIAAAIGAGADPL